MDKSDYYIEMASFEKLKYATELHKLNLEMGEHLSSSLQWIIHYCKKYDIPLPDLDRIQGIIAKVHEIEDSEPSLGFTNRHLTGRNTNREANRTCIKVL